MHALIRFSKENQIIAAVLIILGLMFLLEIKGILVSLFISFIIMAAVIPGVEVLERYRFPKILAILLPYLLVVSAIILLILPLIPFFTSQIQSLLGSFPIYLERASLAFGIDISTKQINSFISPSFNAISQNAFSLTGKVFGGLFLVLTIFIVSFYLLWDHEKMERFVVGLFPKSEEDKTKTTLHLIEHKLGAWLIGQMILSFSVGFVTYIALTILGVEYALPLALLAGIFEIVPTLGPIIAAIPAAIVALSTSSGLAILVILAYILIQVLENNILVPKIMEKAVGLNPVVIIIAILIGGSLMGILGALLAIPLLSAGIILYKTLK